MNIFYCIRPSKLLIEEAYILMLQQPPIRKINKPLMSLLLLTVVVSTKVLSLAKMALRRLLNGVSKTKATFWMRGIMLSGPR